MSEAFGIEYGVLYQKANQDHHMLETLEQERWKTDHCEIGAWLAETWELPEVLREAVRGSHNPSLATSEDETSRLTILCVALSGRLADMWCHPQTETAIQTAIELSQELLEIDTSGNSQVSANPIIEGIPDMSAFFQINLGNSKEIQKVVDLLEQTINGSVPTEHPEPVPAS